MIFTASLLASLFASTLALHVPPRPDVVRNHCSADIGTFGLSIISNALEWKPESHAAGSYIVIDTNSGQPQWSFELDDHHGALNYVIKSIADPNLAISATTHGTLDLQPKANVAHQKWRLECQTCGTHLSENQSGPFNVACEIRNSATGLCVRKPQEATHGKRPLFLQPCTGKGSGSQSFDIVATHN